MRRVVAAGHVFVLARLACPAHPRIADRPRDSLIIVTCMYGGQAALAAQLLCEYGYANVKAGLH